MMHFYSESLQSVGPHPLSGATDYWVLQPLAFAICPQCPSHWMGLNIMTEMFC